MLGFACPMAEVTLHSDSGFKRLQRFGIRLEGSMVEEAQSGFRLARSLEIERPDRAALFDLAVLRRISAPVVG